MSIQSYDKSGACDYPTHYVATDTERNHPRYKDYVNYQDAMRKQLVGGCTFARWLEQTVDDENGFVSVYEVTSRAAKMAPGWWKTVYGPKRRLLGEFGPFDTKEEAEAA